jgi:gliding motility-associated-like protein
MLPGLLLVSATAEPQDCVPFSVPYPNMGVNLPDAVSIPWINLWNQVNPWHSGYFSNPKSGNDLELGPDGWPVAGKSHRLVIGEDISVIITIPADTIKISFKGTVSQFSETDGYTSIIQGSQRDNYPHTGYAYLEVKLNLPVVPITQPGNHSIYAFVFNGHVEDIRIMRPGFDINDNTLIHPDYMRLLDNFSTFRFMPYLQTNAHKVNSEYECEGPSSVDWDERWNPNAPQSCGGTNGGSWEIAVELCNQFGKDLWINIPVVASDEYVIGLARMMRSNLRPGLNINIEIGNETWNWGGGFCCSRQIEDICGEGNGQCHMIWQAERLKQVVEIFASEWGWNEINNRIRGILCGQIGYGLAFSDLGWTIQNGLEYIQNTYNESPGKYFYAVGAAPYFGPQGDFSSVDNIINACRNDIDQNIFGEYSNELWNGIRTGNKFDGWAKLAFENGMKIYCYEGGPDMDYTTGSGGNKALAMRDPRMTELCLDYWTHWYSRYGYNSLFCFFLASFGDNGLYTLGEDFYTTSTRQAAISAITSNPAPSFDISRNVVDPLNGVRIDCRKKVAYMENWDQADAANYLHGGSELNYFIAATRNGRYSLSIEHNCAVNSSVDIFLDGVLIHNDLQFPNTSTVPGDWAFSSYTWTNDQGVTIEFDMNYGVHLLKFHFNNENGSYRYVQARLVSQNPPSMPAAIQGSLSACLGNPYSSYTVDLDGSVCRYEWEVSGGSILPATGGNGAAVTGQGTNLIYVNWNGLPEGEYQISVRGINDVGISPWRTDTVVISSCGFVVNPNPACIGQDITFTPEIGVTIASWNWNFGAGATPATSTAENPHPVRYSFEGTKSVQLRIIDQGGNLYSYVNEVIIGHTDPGITAANPATINAGGSSTISLMNNYGSVIGWEQSTDNVNWQSILSVQLPLNSGPLASSTWFAARVASGGCDTSRSEPVQVVVLNPVNAGMVSPANSTVCPGNNNTALTLSGNDGAIVRWENRTENGNWTTIPGAGTSTYTSQNITSTASYRVIVNINGSEYASQPAMIIVENNLVTLDIPSAYCLGSNIILEGGVPAGGIYRIDNLVFSQLNTLTLGVGPHLVTYEYTDAGNCTGTAEDHLVINPLPLSEILGPDSFCPGQGNATYYTHNRPDYSYSWEVIPGTFQPGANDSLILVNWNHQVQPCEVVLITTDNDTHCSDTVSLEVSPDGLAEPINLQCLDEYRVQGEMENSGLTYTLHERDRVMIPLVTGECLGNIEYSFTYNQGSLVIVNDFTGQRLTDRGENTMEWTVSREAGAAVTCTTRVIFEHQRTIPSAFTPDGVPPNDTWEIDFLANYPLCTISVYNQWGMLVYQSSKGYPEPWNGKSSGKTVPVDSYYYIIDLGNGSELIKGFVTVIR